MATIKEDYVSFEIAKLLKEKGFDEMTDMEYNKYGELLSNRMCGHHYCVHHKGLFPYPAPTLQMAMKWLREVHNLYIWIGHAADKVLSWYYEIHGISDGKVKHIGGIQCGSYEVACEAAVLYCLEHLI